MLVFHAVKDQLLEKTVGWEWVKKKFNLENGELWRRDMINVQFKELYKKN